MDIQKLYKEERYDLLEETNQEYILPLQHSVESFKPQKNKESISYDTYIGLRPAGHFFAYERPNVWVYIANNNTNSDWRARHMRRGFYITITTIDDSALYADWGEPLNEIDLSKVLDYFNILAIDGLDTAKATLNDIENLIGKAKYADFS